MKIDPASQAANLIRYIGDEVAELSAPIVQLSPEDFYMEIGSPSARFAASLLSDLCDQGVVKTTGTMHFLNGGSIFMNVDLTIDGWERYGAEKREQISGDYGFLAMEFGDEYFDAFVREVVKPIVKRELGYNLVDMRDEPQAGIIDNIMREKIKGAVFVIADLTHDNRGAYWEAGYAEGLGKPVVYICEKQKFEQGKTHFDTNHCTTILWSEGVSEHDVFKQNLVDALRRSLEQ